MTVKNTYLDAEGALDHLNELEDEKICTLDCEEFAFRGSVKEVKEKLSQIDNNNRVSVEF